MATTVHQLIISGLHYGQHVENVMNFIGDPTDGTQSLAEGKDLVDSWRAVIESKWLASLPPTYQLLRYEAGIVKPRTSQGNYHLQLINSGLIGTDGVEAQSDNLCPSITTIPPMGTKSPGRIYMPCIAKTSITNNQYTSAYGLLIADLMNELVAGFAASAITWTLAIYSKKNDSATPALSWTLSPAIGFQGKRRRPL